MSRRRSVILLSGGLDSAANLAFTAEKDEAVLALTVDYGQRAAPREIEYARALAANYSVRHEVLDLRWLGGLGGSSLTDRQASVPVFQRSQLDDAQVTRESAKSVWVPNRNGVFINVAAAYAERLDAEQIVVGFNREEAATFPDNTGDFLKAASAALAYSTNGRVRAHCYTTDLNKTEIVARLKELHRPFPFRGVWSCYFGEHEACGHCESCPRLRRALSDNGVQI